MMMSKLFLIPLSSLLILLSCLPLCTSSSGAAPPSVLPTCSDSDDTATSIACQTSITKPVHDPYTPTPSTVIRPSSNTQLMHMWTTPLFIARPKMRDIATFNEALSQRAIDAFNSIATDALATASDIYRGDDAQGINEKFFQWQREQHELGLKAERQY